MNLIVRTKPAVDRHIGYLAQRALPNYPDRLIRREEQKILNRY